MYSHNRKAQSHVCLICHRQIEETRSLSRLFAAKAICDDCRHSFEKLDLDTTICGYPLKILYYYNDFFKGLLFHYKGLYDYALRDAFLDDVKDILRDRYRDYLIALVPADPSGNAKRQFAGNEGIARTFSTHIFNGLYKKRPYKQTEQSFTGRSKIKDIIGLRGGGFLRHQKVLLFDDVITSGETMKSCIKLVGACEPECIEVLVLSSRSHRFIQDR